VIAVGLLNIRGTLSYIDCSPGGGAAGASSRRGPGRVKKTGAKKKRGLAAG